MPDVRVGEGSLGGHGIFASRSFDEGQVVVSYELRRLTSDEYSALPEDERLFVHSYWGERWLYPPPARYVNHADVPNTRQDFAQQCDIALRNIDPGDLITTDARKETDHELTTFLLAYVSAVNANDGDKLETLIDDGAFGWVEPRGHVNRAGIVEYLTSGSTGGAADVRLRVKDPRWIIGTGRWEAICSYDYDIRYSSSPQSAGHVTDVLKVIDGNWQIIYRHDSRS